MMSPVFDLRKKLEFYFFGILVIIAIFYGGWRAYPLIVGPHFTIDTPHDGETVANTTFLISGRVSRVKNIEIQGRAIPIDKEGNFSELLVAQAPETIITVFAIDAYNKTVTKVIRVIPK